MPDCTKIRFAHTQVWPALRYFDATAPAIAASRSASSNTTNGALPPSSSESFFTVVEHCAISSLPTAVEPVKLSLRTIGLLVSSPPIGLESPVTHESTPAGTPARSASTHMASAEYGVSSDGLITIVQPAAKAGATLRAIIAAGKFHGVIAAVTPIACLSTTIRLSRPWDGITSPYARLPSSPNHSMNAAA